MAWTEISERGRNNGMRSDNQGERSRMMYRDGRMAETIAKVKEAKKIIMEICEDLEDPQMAEEFGERRGYRVYEDDDFEERRAYGRRRY